MKLYEISNNYLQVIDKISDCSELDESLIKSIESIDNDFDEKAVNIASIIKNMEAHSKNIDEAIDNMKARGRALHNKIEFLKNYLKENMEKCGKKEVKSTYFDITLKINPPSVLIQDEALIPDHYYKEKITRTIDKLMISNDLKSSKVIPSVVLTNGKRLEIK